MHNHMDEDMTTKHLHDYMVVSNERAGKTEDVATLGGVYRITWDAEGRPIRAARIHS